jgi:catechol 2,3-dioxygenase-like lactoylglutathione lyase family enzyme
VIRVRQFDHVNLNVADVDRSVRFYTEVLGLPVVRRDVDVDGAVTFVSVKAGPQIIDFRPRPEYRPPAEPDPRVQGYNHLALVIEPVDPRELIAYLRGRGVEIQRGPVDNGGAYGIGTAVYFYDPDRYVVELKQYPAGARELGSGPVPA